MGYELYIQRPEDAESISVDEWKSLVEIDAEFKAIEEFSSELPDGSFLEAKIPDSASWNPLGDNVPFMFSHPMAAIVVKNPDEDIIKKMIEVAEKLNAEVTGDDGEVYNRENPLGHFPDSEVIGEIGAVKKNWWEFWK